MIYIIESAFSGEKGGGHSEYTFLLSGPAPSSERLSNTMKISYIHIFILGSRGEGRFT